MLRLCTNSIGQALSIGGVAIELDSHTIIKLNNTSGADVSVTFNMYKEDTQPTTIKLDDTVVQTLTTSGTQDIVFTIPSGRSTIKATGGEWYFDGYCLGNVTKNAYIERVFLGDEYGSKIGVNAFSGGSNILSIRIPDSVVSIGDGAFSNCSKLIYTEGNLSYIATDRNNTYAVYSSDKSIISAVIDSNCKFILSLAFSQCFLLESVSIPNSVVEIGTSAFSNCVKLNNVIIPSSITRINTSTFRYCFALSSISIPESVTYIDSSAFRDCTSLVNIVLPNNLTNIGNYAFGNCNKLTNITIPNSVTYIGSAIFEKCASLTSVVIPFLFETNTVKYPLGYIFGTTSYTGGTSVSQTYISSGSPTSTTYYIPSSLRSVVVIGGNINKGAFQNCSMLTSITMPTELVGRIDDHAFANCSGLTSITIPSGVTSINTDAFTGCSGLTKTIYHSISQIISMSYMNVASNPISIARHIYLASDPNTEITNIVIPDGILRIRQYALYNASSITSIILPNTLKAIEKEAFYGCSQLSGILNIPSSVTSIGDEAFSGCVGLSGFITSGTYTTDTSGRLLIKDTDIIAFAPYGLSGSLVIPSGIETIADNLFEGTAGMTSVTIPNSVTSIGENSFLNCSGLTSVSILGNNVTISNSAFSGCTALEKLIVTSVEYWVNTVLGNAESNPLYNANHLYLASDPNSEVTSITIPNTVTKINAYLFINCTRLTSVTIPSSVTEIGASVFEGCRNITTLTIPNTIKIVAANIFKDCSGLMYVENSITYIKANSNNNCIAYRYTDKTVTSISISSNCVYLWSNVLYGCNKIDTAIVLPNTLKCIQDNAFGQCTKIPSITIPANVEYIGKYAFANTVGAMAISTIEFMHSASDTLEFGENVFKVKTSRAMTVNYYGNQAVANYDYSADNITATLNLLS